LLRDEVVVGPERIEPESLRGLRQLRRGLQVRETARVGKTFTACWDAKSKPHQSIL
jgi:hypothetical protein